MWGFPPSDAGHRKGRMWGGFQLFLGWFPRFVFVTAACADVVVAFAFADVAVVAFAFADVAVLLLLLLLLFLLCCCWRR